MTQKEEKELLSLVPRFKSICCAKMCKCKDSCISYNGDEESVLNCPWFFNYRMYGWPYIKLSDFNYNKPKLPDLREEDIDEKKLKEWLA